jgi:hypothetical protein
MPRLRRKMENGNNSNAQGKELEEGKGLIFV